MVLFPSLCIGDSHRIVIVVKSYCFVICRCHINRLFTSLFTYLYWCCILYTVNSLTTMTDTSTDALELLEACARRNKYDLYLVCMPCGKCRREICM